MELSLLKSIFDGEGISYFVHNDHFGSLKIGPCIDLFNAKTIMVADHQFQEAEAILLDYLGRTRDETSPPPPYPFFDRVRMVVEALLFSWFVPGKRPGKRWGGGPGKNGGGDVKDPG